MDSWSANSYARMVTYDILLDRSRLTYLRHTVFHNLLVRQVGLVADEKLVHTLRRITVNLLQPLLDVCEGVYITGKCKARNYCEKLTVVGDVVDDNDAVCSTVV